MAEAARVEDRGDAPRRKAQRQQRTTLNRRRREDLALAWRVCGFARDHYRVLTGLSESVAKKRLRALAGDRLLAVAGIEPRRKAEDDGGGNPRNFYYPATPTGVRVGASEDGISYARRAATIWSDRANLPQHAEHAATRLDFYCLLLLAADAENARVGGEVLFVSAGDLRGETHPEAPLVGRTRALLDRAGEPVSQEGRRKVYDTTYPDGSFTVRWNGGADLSVWLEVERSAKPDYASICKKIGGYASHWLRMQEALPEEAPLLSFESFRPLLVLVPTADLAMKVRAHVRERLPGEKTMRRYRELAGRLDEGYRDPDPDRARQPGETFVGRGGATLGRFVLFGGLGDFAWTGEVPRTDDELVDWARARRVRDLRTPFDGDAYVPLSGMVGDLAPEGSPDWTSLAAVAEELRRVRVGESEAEMRYEHDQHGG